MYSFLISLFGYGWITAKQIFEASKPGPTSYAAVTAGPSTSAVRPATPGNRTPHPDETSENNKDIREESLEEFNKFSENITKRGREEDTQEEPSNKVKKRTNLQSE